MADKKTAAQTPAKVPQPHGGALLVAGVKGNKGGSGRPRNSLREFLAGLRGNPNALAAIERAATDETNRNFGNAWKLAAEYDLDKPVQKTGIQGDVQITVKFARE